MPQKQTYHAYQIYTAGEAAGLGVDADPAKLLLRMAEDLKIAQVDGGVEEIEVGQVRGSDSHRCRTHCVC
jgi:hypothetical protein